MAEFRVVAIIAAYNEADIIAQVVADLIDQGIEVYLLDDGSTDGSAARVEPFLGRGVIAIEPLHPPAASAAHSFDLETIVARKAAVAAGLDADWFINHDADEFRESPWAHLTLRDAIRRVDRLGFNAIDFHSLDFWPIDDRRPDGDVRAAFTHCSAAAPYDRLQIRCWKKIPGVHVDLASSGGHDVRFDGRRVFPIRFISRHYPVRGQEHGERKVFAERRGRFRQAERDRGWHVQYDTIEVGASFVRDAGALARYDPDDVRDRLVLHHRGLEELEASLQARDAELACKDAAISAREAEIEAIRHENDERARALARCESSNGELQNHLAEQTRALDAAREEIEAARRQLASAREFMEHQGRTAEALAAALDDVSKRVEAMDRSLSWRWTAPARAVLRAITRR